jgi:ribosome-interacting GTPase 1
MPANLPPNYFEAEKRYREAKEPSEKVEALEEMLTIMPKHKGTDKLRADLRRKISKFKNQSQKKKGASKRDSAYSIDREGAAQVIVVGPPNSGKSSLISVLTNAKPEVTSFPHSTWKPTPGMVPYENIQFQLVDTPPLTADYLEPLLGDLIRRGDIVVILIDIRNGPLKQFDDTFSLLQDLRIFPDAFPVPQDLKKPPFIKKMLVLVNKLDTLTDEEDYEIFLELWETNLPCLGISTQTGKNLDNFVQLIYDLSNIIRVFTKAPGKKHDSDHPFVLPKESTLEDLASKIHKDFVTNLKFARVWGKEVFDGQMVQRDHVLQDGDVVEIHT